MTPDRKAKLLRLMTELRRLMAEWSAFRATLAGADLTEADLGGAPLEGANLEGADLWGACDGRGVRWVFEARDAAPSP